MTGTAKPAANEPRYSVGVIINPAAGKARALKTSAILCQRMAHLGMKVTILHTNAPGHARELTSEHCQDFELLAAVGGDGTINEVINGLADAQSLTPLLVVPAGTANVIARELHLPQSIEELANLARCSAIKGLDLGIANGRRFAMCLGAGLDGSIVRRMSRHRTAKGISMLSYIPFVLQEIFGYPFSAIRVCIDGQEVEKDCTFTVVGNMRRYGGPFSFFRDARADDGMLDVFCFRGRRVWDFIKLAWRALCGKVGEFNEYGFYQGRQVSLVSEQDVAVQVDGDMGGELPQEIELLPHAVQFCVPSV